MADDKDFQPRQSLVESMSPAESVKKVMLTTFTREGSPYFLNKLTAADLEGLQLVVEQRALKTETQGNDTSDSIARLNTLRGRLLELRDLEDAKAPFWGKGEYTNVPPGVSAWDHYLLHLQTHLVTVHQLSLDDIAVQAHNQFITGNILDIARQRM